MSVILGLGHDVVAVAAFADQLAKPGSRMRSLFSTRELRQSGLRAHAKHDSESGHLAVRWAGKEAVLKAWSQALGERPAPYSLDDFPWSRVEILDDSRGRPSVVLGDDVAHALAASLPASRPAASGRSIRGGELRWLLSLSHDGPVASAVCLLAVDDALDAGSSVGAESVDAR